VAICSYRLARGQTRWQFAIDGASRSSGNAATPATSVYAFAIAFGGPYRSVQTNSPTAR
jgi:hypothetical protein